MSRFIGILKKVTGIKVIENKMSAIYKEGDDLEEIAELAVRSRLTFRRDPEIVPPPKRRNKIITTADLDTNNKLFPDYLKRRLQRKKKREQEEKNRGWGVPSSGTGDIWKI